MQVSTPQSIQPPLFDTPAPARAPLAIEAPRFIDRDEQLPLWETPASVHLTQYRSDVVPDAVPNTPQNGNCGPTSALMALRLVGLDLPGFHGEDSERAIEAARLIGTGKVDNAEWTDPAQMRRVLEAGGARVSDAGTVSNALHAVRQGKVLLAMGNTNADSWWTRPFDKPDMPIDAWGGHFVTVSEFHPVRDVYTVNDPGFERPLHLTGAQLKDFLGGSEPIGSQALIVDGPGNVVRNDATERPT